MARESETAGLTHLERLDVALAARISALVDQLGDADFAAQQFATLKHPVHTQRRWIAGTLGLRGFAVRDEDVRDVLGRCHGRFEPSQQEYKLITGLAAVLGDALHGSEGALMPEGWSLVRAFQLMTVQIDRFRNNHHRLDRPWDLVRGVPYPDPDQVAERLDEFVAENRYGETREEWEGLHPVRRSFRILWRFARIAPFPDLNLILAFVAMNQHLLATGYPLVVPEASDRAMLTRLVANPKPPWRVVQFESRLLQALED